MSSAIVRNGYGKQLILQSDDPFAFVYLYQKSAKKDKTPLPRFSEAAMRYLKELDRKYARPRPRSGHGYALIYAAGTTPSSYSTRLKKSPLAGAALPASTRFCAHSSS